MLNLGLNAGVEADAFARLGGQDTLCFQAGRFIGSHKLVDTSSRATESPPLGRGTNKRRPDPLAERRPRRRRCQREEGPQLDRSDVADTLSDPSHVRDGLHNLVVPLLRRLHQPD